MSTALTAQYEFNGEMDQQTLERYLARSITMQGLSNVNGEVVITTEQRDSLIQMLGRLDAKFIGRIAGWWSSVRGQTALRQFFEKTKENVDQIKEEVPDAICQAGIFEVVNPLIGSFYFPKELWDTFGVPKPQGCETNKYDCRLNYEDMLYEDGTHVGEFNNYSSIPDISRVSTQMWFYFLATKYIDAGCEALHLGQAEKMAKNDPGNANWWKLLKMIRAYAATKNRGLVLCDAHTDGMYFTPAKDSIQDQEKQLLFDFHSLPARFDEFGDCTSKRHAVIIRTYPDKHMYNRSKGGRNPLGWICSENPYLVEVDNWGIQDVVGCAYPTPEDYTVYGWDEISWFGVQSESHRNEIIEYTYWRVRCLDPHGTFQVPGLRGVQPGGGVDEFQYMALRGRGNQEDLIKKIWDTAQIEVPEQGRHSVLSGQTIMEEFYCNHPILSVYQSNLNGLKWKKGISLPFNVYFR